MQFKFEEEATLIWLAWNFKTELKLYPLKFKIKLLILGDTDKQFSVGFEIK